MKARIHVFLKDGVFDPQGNTVAGSLKSMGFKKVHDIRIGKVIDIELSHESQEEAKRDAQKMCEQLLVNPVIESFKIEIIAK